MDSEATIFFSSSHYPSAKQQKECDQVFPMSTAPRSQLTFRDRSWQYTYKTSSMGAAGQPVNILHDFYIPVLKRSVAYDRVAGYFRSSSLAAASQGFSAFTEACGKMRMIVGADMAPDDVAAILQGDEKRMTDRLNNALEKPETWPEDVKRGVELLCWVVANGCLEVRVAFRIHKETGEPLPFDSRADGYVHEKWGIFTDPEGSRLYMAGSLNESRQALVHNAENINVHADWWGRSDQQRIEEAALSFENLWENQNPHIRVLTLPEAVSRNMIRIAQSVTHPKEIDGSSAFQPAVDPPPALERLKFALIKDGPTLPGGRFVGMETAPVKPWPHQEVVARRLVTTWPYHYLLCDEVGLGKTIEAGLAIRSLYLSGFTRRILIAPPASLTQQWHREMASKFFLPFARIRGGATVRHDYIHPYEETFSAAPLYDPDLCIISTGLLSRKQRLPELALTKKFDLALVDEAHYARRKEPKNGERRHPQFGLLYRAIRDHLIRQTESLWLATATPMQLDWIEVFDLIHLTYRIAHFQRDPTLTWAYYRSLGKLVRDQPLNQHEWDFLGRAVSTMRGYDPFLWSFFEEAVIDGTIRSATKQWFQQGRTPRGRDRKNIQRLIFAAAPLSRVMLRHTRSLLEIYRQNGQLGANLAKRQILPVPELVLTGLEKKTYDALEEYCQDLTQQIEANNPDNRWRTSLGFYLSFLRLRLASSIFALRETLKRRKERVSATHAHIQQGEAILDNDLEQRDGLFGDNEEIDETVVETLLKNRSQEDLVWEENRLAEMLFPLADLSKMPIKMKELLRVLQERRLTGGRISQTVIFTRFYDTLTDIVNRLRGIDQAMLIGTYSGKGGQYVDPRTNQLRGVDREEIKQRFLRQEIDVLICTDAAAEGLNLQTADLIINYDLPWNPMKVEQRIGRIDRIGQTHDQIHVLNLCYVDSAEQIVYDRLLKRLAQAGDVVGSQQISMLPVTEDEFADLAAGKLKKETLLKRAQERIKLQKQRTESMEIPAEDLYSIYLRSKEKRDKNRPPVTLVDIWDALANSRYLRDLGSTVYTGKTVMTMCGIEKVPDQVKMTIDRGLYENQAPDMKQIHFASYGDPVFEQVVNSFDQFDLPSCVVRLTETIPETHAEVVAYVAACIVEDGQPETRLITSYSDLAGLDLNEDSALDPKDLAAHQEKLHKLMRDEFDPIRKVEQLIQENQQAGRDQEILNLLIAHSLFSGINDTDQDNFWQAVATKDQLVESRDELVVPNIPTSPLSKIHKDLLFDIHFPRTGSKTTPTLPILLIKSAIDTACRVADGMKEKKSELTIGNVRGKISREIKRLL